MSATTTATPSAKPAASHPAAPNDNRIPITPDHLVNAIHKLTLPTPKALAQKLHLPIDQLEDFLTDEQTCDTLRLRQQVALLQLQLLGQRFAPNAFARLISLTDSEKPDVARKSCLAILQFAGLDPASLATVASGTREKHAAEQAATADQAPFGDTTLSHEEAFHILGWTAFARRNPHLKAPEYHDEDPAPIARFYREGTPINTSEAKDLPVDSIESMDPAEAATAAPYIPPPPDPSDPDWPDPEPFDAAPFTSEPFPTETSPANPTSPNPKSLRLLLPPPLPAAPSPLPPSNDPMARSPDDPIPLKPPPH